MNTNPHHVSRAIAATVLALACAGTVAAQPQMDPADQRRMDVRPRSCAQVDIGWNAILVEQYPQLPEACHEVVTSNGIKWARFEADFVRINRDGSVTSDFRAPNGRSMGRFTMEPAPGQTVNIGGRQVEFRTLQPGQRLSMYVPEGATAIAFAPGEPPERFSRIIQYEEAPVETARPAPAPAPVRSEPAPVVIAQARPTVLPNTAGPLPWFALGGLLSLFGAVGLRLGRRSH